MLWSELSPWRLEVELAKAGTTVHDLETDIRDVPELKPWVEGISAEARRQLAIEYFGDQRHQQPPREQRTKWHSSGYTREFGRLPQLKGDESRQAKVAKPRHRHPAPISKDTIKKLKWELAKRREELAQQKPRGEREYTQEKIAERLELDDTRVQQAEALHHVGWELLRTHPEFSVDEGFVRWPSAEDAARILASEHAEN